jgi:hypothetical protein
MNPENAWLWGPLVVIGAALLWAGPIARLPAEDETKAREIITPLNVRDPSALIMGPAPVSCRGACPSTERPAKAEKPR